MLGLIFGCIAKITAIVNQPHALPLHSTDELAGRIDGYAFESTKNC